MSAHSSRENGLLALERTGPFCPPLTFPGIGDIVIVESLRQEIEASGLTGVVFKPVVKKLIVAFAWEEWDWNLDDPPEFPETGKPEDYVLDHDHSELVAEQMGPLWEAALETHAEAARIPFGTQSWEVEIRLVESTWDGTDLFKASESAYLFASERARLWIEQSSAGKWVHLEPAQTVAEQ